LGKEWGNYRVLKKIQYDSTASLYLDIGCKDKKKQGYIGIDILNFGQEIVWDIRYGIPFADSTVEKIYCSHLLEHLENKDIQDFFIEMHRVCKDGAEIELRAPHSDTVGAYYGCHLSLWNQARIEGIITGLIHMCIFEIKKNEQDGKELVATIEVKKK
jgi:hypothetical protein